jgi:hypothetical protein
LVNLYACDVSVTISNFTASGRVCISVVHQYIEPSELGMRLVERSGSLDRIVILDVDLNRLKFAERGWGFFCSRFDSLLGLDE